MEGINLEESGSEPLKPQICIFQARKSLDNDLIQSSHNYVDMYLAQDPTIGPCEALEGEQVAIKEGTPPDLKGAHLSVPIADDDQLGAPFKRNPFFAYLHLPFLGNQTCWRPNGDVPSLAVFGPSFFLLLPA